MSDAFRATISEDLKSAEMVFVPDSNTEYIALTLVFNEGTEVTENYLRGVIITLE